jgi:hypothetical protein
MRNLLLATAAIVAAAAVPAFPAQAQSADGRTSFSINHGFDGHGSQRGRHRDRRSDDGVVVGTWYEGGEWALYNNRSFESDSYNDWWHDRPDRAFPRWVQNGKCERLWWSGGGWRC